MAKLLSKEDSLSAIIAAYFLPQKHSLFYLLADGPHCPAIILDQSVGRIVNFMNGDVSGHPVEMNFWPTIYPDIQHFVYQTYGLQTLK